MTMRFTPPNGRWLIGVYVVPVVLLVLVVLISGATGRPIADFFRDPASIARMPPFLGLMSNLGVLLWCAAATVAMFAAILLRSYALSRAVVGFFVCMSLFTATLMLDDLFMLHERMLPKLLGIRENFIVLSYPVILGAMLVYFRPVYAAAPAWFLVSALSFFSLSVGIDVFEGQVPTVPYLIEDGFKFLGIASWLAWLAQVARYFIVETLAPAQSD